LLASSHRTCMVWCCITVLDSWWWTDRPSDTCRVLFQNKINLRYCASSWFYYRNLLRCTVPQTTNRNKCNSFIVLIFYTFKHKTYFSHSL
jgi:hypothetical protein